MKKQQVLEMKTVTITEKGQISIPKEIRAQSGFKEGSKVVVITFRDHIELRPLRHVSEGALCYIASESSLAKDWLSPEDEKAWKDL